MIETSKLSKGLAWFTHPTIKGFTTYLLILLPIYLLVTFISLSFSDSIVIYAQKDKPDFMQIFFKIDGAYSEENSERSTLFGNSTNGVKINLPRILIDHVRIDPANEATEILITKIELKHLLSTETLMPNDLLAHAKPLQMIDKMEVTTAGLLIRSTGNDPAFELQLKKSPRLYYQIELITISALLSLTVLFVIHLIKRLNHYVYNNSKEHGFFWQNLWFIVATMFVCGSVLYAVFPGFMSYDSLHALREARGIVQGGTYPPFVSYVWRLFDFFWPGPSLMLMTQNLLLLVSVGVLLKQLKYDDKMVAILIILIALLPPLLGSMVVVWKDVSVAACFAATVACFKSAETSKNKNAVLIIGIFFLFCGAAFRFNAISGAIPLLMWLSYKRYYKNWGAAKSYLSSFLVFIWILVSVFVINNYRIPTFERLAPNNGFEVIMTYDFVGVSVFASKTLLPVNDSTTGNSVPITYLKQIYEPKHINLTIDNDRENRLSALKSMPRDAVRSGWFSMVYNYPLEYINHRVAVFSGLIGATDQPMFYPTHGIVDDNEFGITQQRNPLTTTLLNYISETSSTFMSKPWFYYLMGFVAVILAKIFNSKIDYSAMFFIFSSGIFYILPFFFISPAADLRYNLWAITSMLMTILIAATKIDNKAKSL